MKRWAAHSPLATDASCKQEAFGLEGRTVCGAGWSDMPEVDEDGALLASMSLTVLNVQMVHHTISRLINHARRPRPSSHVLRLVESFACLSIFRAQKSDNTSLLSAPTPNAALSLQCLGASRPARRPQVLHSHAYDLLQLTSDINSGTPSPLSSAYH